MNIYELLNELNLNASINPDRKLFTEEKKDFLDSDEEKELFELIKNVSSLSPRKTEQGFIFHPYLQLNAVKIFAIDDLTDDDYARLKALNLPEIPTALRARICDILWVQKKDYEAARSAAQNYLSLFEILLTHTPEKVEMDIEMAAERAVSISKQLRDSDLLVDIHKTVYDTVKQLKKHDKGVLRLRLLEILVSDKYGDQEELASIADEIIESAPESILKVEQAYIAKANCFHNMNNQEAVKKCKIQRADFYVEYADKMVDQQIQGASRADHFYNEAIKLYRNNGEKDKTEKTMKRQSEVRKTIPEEMHTFVKKLDVESIHNSIDENFRGLTFEESIVMMTQLISFYKKDDVKKELLDGYKKTPLLGQITKKKFDATGRNILILRPLNLQNPDEDPALLNKYINQELQRKCVLVGDIIVRYSLNIIRSSFDLQKVNMAFLVKDNAIIPEGRQEIFASALMMFLTGRYYECVHILAPQTENLFRYIAKECGDVTTTLEDDGISKEKVLSSVFELPELLDCYDNDILFLFKALLNEPSGSNIRNDIAHGITDAGRANSGDYLFFDAAVMKLLAYTLPGCEKYQESEKLKKIITPANENHG